MARIHINDLTPIDGLTPEQEEQFLGAGRPSFRPMLESLENREMYTANVTAALTAGVLNVQGLHATGTPQDNAAALHHVGSQIQVLSGLKNEIGRWFDAAQAKSIDMLMTGGNALVNLTGLGKPSADASFNAQTAGGTADVHNINQTGPTVREWDKDGRHNKETTMTNGDKVLEQSWQAGEKTFHFVTVTDTQGRQLVTGEDNGNGFVVTRTNPGVGETKFKFDRYGGMWDGQQWVPEQGQKLVERDGKAVHGEWKMIDNKLRWTMTTGTRETNQSIGVFEKYGRDGDGEGIVSLEKYSNGKPTLKEIHRADGTMLKEDYSDGTLIRKETKSANGDSVVENYTNGQLTRLEKTYPTKGESLVEVYTNGQLTQRSTTSKGVSVVEDYTNGQLTRRKTESNGVSVVEDYTNGQLTRKATTSNSGSVVEDYTNGQLTRRTTTSKGVSVVEDITNGVVRRRETTGGEFRSRIEIYNEAGKLQTVDTTDHKDVRILRELKEGKWFETTTGSSEFKERVEIWNEARTTLLERRTTLLNKGWSDDTHSIVETLQGDGTWKVTRIGVHKGAGQPFREFKTETEVYDRMGGKLLSYEKIYTDGGSIRKEWIAGQWVEVTREANGSYTKNVWKKQDHGAEGSKDHISKSILDKQQGFFQVFTYNVSTKIWWGGAPYTYNDAWEGRQYSLDKDGNPNFSDLQLYNVHSRDGYENWWQKGGGSGYWGNGWKEWRYGGPPELANPGQYLA
ncbi:MAG TPA: hypothetical protein VH643_25795 [Gemmataceae bacterium]